MSYSGFRHSNGKFNNLIRTHNNRLETDLQTRSLRSFFDRSAFALYIRYTMRLISTFHVCVLALLVGYGVLSAHQPTLWTAVFWTIVVIYSAVIVGIFRGSRRILQLSVFPPTLLVVLSAPMVIWNVIAFLTGHPLYLDSPGTILVVTRCRDDGHSSIDCRARLLLGASARDIRPMTHNPPLEPMSIAVVYSYVLNDGSAA